MAPYDASHCEPFAVIASVLPSALKPAPRPGGQPPNGVLWGREMGIVDEPVLVVRPQAHFLLARTFLIEGAGGRPAGTIGGTSTLLRMTGADGSAVATFERPWMFFRVRVDVKDATGAPVGSAVQLTPLARIRFELRHPGGRPLGALTPNGFGAFSFDLIDTGGARLGTLGRRYRWWLRTGDYTLEFTPGADTTTRLLALAAVVGVDKVVHRRRANDAGGGG